MKKHTRYLSPNEAPPFVFEKAEREIFLKLPSPVYDPEGRMLVRLAAIAHGREKLKSLGWKEKTANA